MKYYKVFYWLSGIFNFEIVEVPHLENEKNAIFTVREYFRAMGLISQLRISHARLLYLED